MGSESIEGVYTPTEWIKAELDTTRILKQRIIGNTAYMAYRDKDTTDVYAVVIGFTRRTYGGRTVELIGKIMDESVGPCYYKCPRGILELLTPTKDMYALQWRAKNWANYDVHMDWISMISDEDRRRLTSDDADAGNFVGQLFD